jgi:colanic acid biosynthesis glycosyl transferase WcaI
LRILVYGLNYTPELTGVGKYTGEMAAWLARRGHDVRVIAAPPYYPAWRIRDEYRNTLYRTERSAGGPTVFRTPLYVPAKPTGAKRLIHLFSFMLGSLPVVFRQLWWNPEVVFTVEPTFFCAPSALLLARLTGAPSWLHIQDFEVDAAFDMAMLPPGGLLHRLAEGFDRFFTRQFDCVSAISSKMIERAIASKGVDPARAVYFPDWVDLDEIRPLEGRNSFRRELGLEGKTIVLYAGNMGAKQGLDVLGPLTAACSAHPDIHFLLCGNGPLRGEIERIASERTNVTLLPLQPLDRFNELLNAADIHLLPQRGRVGDLVMPSKLLGMLASGRPVVATVEPGTHVESVLSGNGSGDPCGVGVPVENIDALCDAVIQLAADRPRRERLGQRAREYAIQYLGKEEVLGRFEDSLMDLVHPRGRSSPLR